MTVDELQRLIAHARPGTKLRILEIEIPVARGEADPDDGESAANGSIPSEAGSARPTLAQRAAEIGTEAGEPFKIEDWTRRLPISGRELERAVAFGAITDARPKGMGRDHRAQVIPADAMVTYLATCDGVQRGRIPAPNWWTNVRKGSNATING